MLKRSCKPLALAILAAISVPAGAVAVNDMAVWSEAGAPLRMDIELTELNASRLGDINVRVASAADHERLGVTRPAWGDQVRFQLLKAAGGKLVARASTSAPIEGDFVSFLVYIRADGQSRLQQVAGKVSGSSLVPVKVTPDMLVERNAVPAPAPARAEMVVAAKAEKPAAAVKPAAAPAPTPVAAPVSKPAAAAPAPAPAPVAAPVAAAPEPLAPVATPEAPAAGADSIEAISQERAALQQGLQAAQAQVADIETRLKALDDREAALNGTAAPADEAAAADAVPVEEEAAAPAPVEAPRSAGVTLLSEHFDAFMALFMAVMFGIVALVDRKKSSGQDPLPDDVVADQAE